MLDVLIGFGAMDGLESGSVPIEFFADAISDIAEEGGFGEGARVIEAAGGLAAGFASFDPFFVMANGLGNVRFGSGEA